MLIFSGTLLMHPDNLLECNQQKCYIYGAINQCDEPCIFIKLEKIVKMFQVDVTEFVGTYRQIQ